MILHKHKCIFIHIPKCAGTAVEISFTGRQYTSWDRQNCIWRQHATATQVKEIYLKDSKQFKEFHKFTFVRNPWSRAVSDYFWIKKDLKLSGTFKSYLLLKDSFNDRRLKQPQSHLSTRADHLLPQCNFILDKAGKPLVDFIGRFERIQQDFNIVCDKIGITRKELLHKNKTKHKHYTEYYDDETRQIVAEKYAKDIEYFGYEYGE